MFPRGSEWRKWDLQIHVPQAKHANQYKPTKGHDIWSDFIQCVEESDVSVFGITDYYSFDGYEAFLGKIKDNSNLQNRQFFPCIEFRLDVAINAKAEQLQCHLIFDNNYDLNEIKEFLKHLPLKNKKDNGSTAYCTHTDIEACGGYDRVSITVPDLEKSLSDKFGNDRPYLIAGVARGMGSNRADPNRNIKRELADQFDFFCDLFFGQEEDVDYYLSEDRYDRKTMFAQPKPVVATSDCHTLDDCKSRLGQKFIVKSDNEQELERYGFSWIKSDPTFEGLRQITFEPKDRVKFGYEMPEQKKSYYLIDKVRFIDNTGDENFPSDYIAINQNLATTIGGKSTGKSLLLYYLAKTIDPQELENRFADYSNANLYNFEDSPNFNFEVTWGDGDITYLKNLDDSDDLAERKILYLPQNYLNKLSEKNTRSRDTLNKFVMDVLLQDKNLQEKYEDTLDEINRLSKSIQLSVDNFHQLDYEINEIEENIKQLGDEKGIKKYITKLEKDAKTIKNKSGLSSKEIRIYENLLEKEKNISTSTTILLDDKKSLFSFKQKLIQQLDGMSELRDEQIAYLGDKEIRNELSKKFITLDSTRKKLISAVDSIISSVNRKITSNEAKMEKIKKRLAPYTAKVQLQDELKEKSEAIKLEQKKLDEIALENKNLNTKKKLYNKEKIAFVEGYKSIFMKYDNVRNEFKKYEDKFEDISLNVSVGFKQEHFNDEVIGTFLNKPDIKRQINSATWKDEYEYQYDPQTHLKFISNIVGGIISKKIGTIQNRSAKDAMKKVLKDYFQIDFKITYRNDPLDKMSPGKKGLVLLRLLIDLSDEEWPILLDQPEDDLDNRSVYDDLVSFIKSKKKKRQIIIVTHNPNLVVGADAEQIIVANQEGQEKGRDNKKYRFEYVSGSLENSFELTKTKEKAILFRKGIRQHVCEILEGGKEAFLKRERKYNF